MAPDAPLGTPEEAEDSSVHRTTLDKIACVVIGAGATALPLLLVLAQNGQRIADRWLVVRTAAFAAVIAGTLVLILQRFLDWRAAGLTVAAVGYTFFLNSWVANGNGPLFIRFLLWGCMAIFGVIVVRTLIGHSSAVLRVVSLAVLSLTVIFGVVGQQSGSSGEVPTNLALADLEPIETPNVYVLVMDGLSGVDKLKSEFPGISIDEPVERLESMGFSVSDISTANYARTHLSIPSLLSGEYQATNENRPDLDGEWDYAKSTLSGNNRLVQTLRGAGYEYWHAQSEVWGHANCSPIHADYCIGRTGSDPETSQALWAMTPLGSSPTRNVPQDPTRVIDYVLANAESDGPRLVFAHILSPHNPYKFDAECNSIWVGSLVEGWQTSYSQMYADETECLMTMLADSMEKLLAADPDAMVLLLSDHGHSFGIAWHKEAWSDRDVDVRFSNFRLARVPDRCRTDDPRGHSLVNVSELIASCLAGREPSWQDIRLFTSVEDGVLEVPDEQFERIFGR